MTETTTETQTPETETTTTEVAPTGEKKSLADLISTLDEDSQKVVLGEVEKARKEAEGLRKRVKEAEPKAQQFDTLQAAQLTAEQRAAQELQAARDSASTAMQNAAKVTVKAALAGVVADPDSVIEDLNLARFVTDDGEIDEAAVVAIRAKYAALGGPQQSRAPQPDRSQASGANGGTTTTPRSEFGSLLKNALTT